MSPDDFGKLVTTLGVPLTILVWFAIGVIKLVFREAPAVLNRYQARKTDQVEHTQEIESRRLRHSELMELTEAGSRTYTEEQLTQHLSEVYSEFGSANTFIRETVFVSLQRIEGKLDQVLIDIRNIAPMTERIAEIRMYVRAISTSVTKGQNTHNENLEAVEEILDKLDLNGPDVERQTETSSDEVERS